MPRRIVASVTAPNRPGTYVSAATPMSFYMDCMTRCRAPGLDIGFAAECVAEYSSDYDPVTKTGTWAPISGLRTPSVNASARAQSKTLDEADRPSGGYVRLVLIVSAGNGGSQVHGELWSDPNTYEDALGIAPGRRARPQDLDNRKNLSDPNVE